MLSLQQRSWDVAACALFIVASLTDMLDGYLARKYNNVSQMGKLLDPLADKLLVISVLVTLLALGRVHYIYAIILIAREFAINSLRGIAVEEGVVIASSPLAKYKTATQLTAMGCLIIADNEPRTGLFTMSWYGIGQTALLIATILSLVSAWQYFRSYRVGYMKQQTDGR